MKYNKDIDEFYSSWAYHNPEKAESIQRIVVLKKLGKSNKQISVEVGISIRSIQYYLKFLKGFKEVEEKPKQTDIHTQESNIIINKGMED